MEYALENGTLIWSPTADGAVAERVYTEASDFELPAELDGRTLTAVGARAFSPDLRSNAPWSKNLRSVVLPSTVRAVGDYAFYNCEKLERLQVGAAAEQWGTGCLMNCRSLHRLTVTDADGPSRTLCYFAEELPVELDVTVLGRGEPLRLIFPEYIEDFENNDPAHHFDFHLYGPGFPYHHAFTAKQLDLGLFDGAWAGMLAREYDPACALRLAFWRLRCPRGLSSVAEENYAAYVDAHLSDAMIALVQSGERAELEWLLTRFSPSNEAFSAALGMTRASALHDMTALLLNEQHRRFSTPKKRTFDL